MAFEDNSVATGHSGGAVYAGGKVRAPILTLTLPSSTSMFRESTHTPYYTILHVAPSYILQHL